MTNEELKTKNREKMRRYRARHANDPVYKTRVREEKRRQLAKNTERCVEISSKMCTSCREIKLLEDFHASKYTKCGRVSSCAECVCAKAKTKREENLAEINVAKKEYWQKNKEHRKQYARNWIAENKEKSLEYGRKYAVKHRDKRVAAKRAFNQNNKEMLNEQRLKRHAKNPVLRYAVDASRRAKRHSAMPSWADKSEIKTFYAAAKKMTAETGIVWHVDHIVPLKHKLVSGLHVTANLQLLPSAENISKGNRFLVA